MVFYINPADPAPGVQISHARGVWGHLFPWTRNKKHTLKTMRSTSSGEQYRLIEPFVSHFSTQTHCQYSLEASYQHFLGADPGGLERVTPRVHIHKGVGGLLC